MASITAGDILKCTFVVRGLNGQVAQPSCHFLVGITAGSPDSLAVAAALDLIAAATLLPALNNTATYLGTIAQVIAPLPVEQRDVSTTSSGPGTAGATPMPQQASPVISFTTPLAGPKHRGRMFFPFPPSTAMNVATGEMTLLYKGTLQAFASALIALATVGGGGNTAAVFLALFHRVTMSADVINSAIVHGKFGTQKKRGNYGEADTSPI